MAIEFLAPHKAFQFPEGLNPSEKDFQALVRHIPHLRITFPEGLHNITLAGLEPHFRFNLQVEGDGTGRFWGTPISKGMTISTDDISPAKSSRTSGLIAEISPENQFLTLTSKHFERNVIKFHGLIFYLPGNNPSRAIPKLNFNFSVN